MGSKSLKYSISGRYSGVYFVFTIEEELRVIKLDFLF
jgi:ribosomal protein S6